jgi:cytochrome P450
MGENRKTNPVDMHPHNHPALLAEEFNLGPVFLFDTYPIGPPMLILNDPELAHDVSAVQVYPKDPLLKEALYPFAGPEHLAVMEGPLWKKWRAIFNPGFSMTHLMTLVPLIVDCTQLLVDHLNQDAAKNEPFRIEEALTHLTIDVIGRVVL